MGYRQRVHSEISSFEFEMLDSFEFQILINK